MQMTGKGLRMVTGMICAGLIATQGNASPVAPQTVTQVAEVRQKISANWRAADWCVEQMPGGTVRFENEVLTIEDKGGCTVWLKTRLHAPLRIQFKVKMISQGGPLDRVSDLNCFWMATDPAGKDGSVLGESNRRSGAFADYDSLKTYYVGMGGNTNTTTRLRRYAGNGQRPLLPEHDLKGTQVLLEANREYLIEIESTVSGIRYLRDGVVLFDWKDPQPLTEGYFGFRTVWSHMEIRDFRLSP